MKSAAAIEKRLASCEGKARFSTFAMAERTAHRQAQKRKEKFLAYACHVCGEFHVGTTIGGESGRIRSDPRYPYIVFVRNEAGSEFIFGWANVPGGGRVAEIAAETPGLVLSRIVPRKPRAA